VWIHRPINRLLIHSSPKCADRNHIPYKELDQITDSARKFVFKHVFVFYRFFVIVVGDFLICS